MPDVLYAPPPPCGAQVRAGHPLAKGLRCSVRFNERGNLVYNLVTGRPLVHVAGATLNVWAPTGLWLGKSYRVLGVLRTEAEVWFQGDAGYTVVCHVSTTDATNYDGLWGFNDDIRYDEASGLRFKQEGVTAQDSGDLWPLTGTPTFYVGTRAPNGDLEGLIDLVSIATASSSPALSTTEPYLNIGSYYDSTLGGKSAIWHGFDVWERVLSLAELGAHIRDPGGVFRIPRRVFLFGGVAGPTLVEVTDSGGLSAETVSVAKDMAVNDAGVGAEAVLVDKALEETDAGAGVDAVVVEKPVSVEETGGGAEAVSVDKEIPLADSGGLSAEVVDVDQTVGVSDSGGLSAETVSVDAELIIADAGAGSGAVLLTAGKIVADAGAGVDQEVVDKLVVVADAGAGAGAVFLAASKIVADLGAGVDVVSVSVAGAATGPLAAPAAALEVLVANSSTWQTLTGTGDAGAAAGYVHLGAVAAAGFARPFAGIDIPQGGWRMERVSAGASGHFVHRGELRLAIELDVDPADSPAEAEAAYVASVEAILKEVADLSETDDHLVIDSITRESGPTRAKRTEAATSGDYYQSAHLVAWGGV